MCAQCLQIKDAGSFSMNSLTTAEQPTCLSCFALSRKQSKSTASSQQRDEAQMATATATAAHLTKAQVRNLRRAQKRHAGNNKTADGVEETKSSDNADVSVAPAEAKQDQTMLKTFREFVKIGRATCRERVCQYG